MVLQRFLRFNNQFFKLTLLEECSEDNSVTCNIEIVSILSMTLRLLIYTVMSLRESRLNIFNAVIFASMRILSHTVAHNIVACISHVACRMLHESSVELETVEVEEGYSIDVRIVLNP